MTMFVTKKQLSMVASANEQILMWKGSDLQDALTAYVRILAYEAGFIPDKPDSRQQKKSQSLDKQLKVILKIIADCLTFSIDLICALSYKSRTFERWDKDKDRCCFDSCPTASSCIRIFTTFKHNKMTKSFTLCRNHWAVTDRYYMLKNMSRNIRQNLEYRVEQDKVKKMPLEQKAEIIWNMVAYYFEMISSITYFGDVFTDFFPYIQSWRHRNRTFE